VRCSRFNLHFYQIRATEQNSHPQRRHQEMELSAWAHSQNLYLQNYSFPRQGLASTLIVVDDVAVDVEAAAAALAESDKIS